MFISLSIHGALVALVAYMTLDMTLPEGHVVVDFNTPPEGESLDHKGEINTTPLPKISKAKKNEASSPPLDKNSKRAKTVRPPSEKDISPTEVKETFKPPSEQNIKTVEIEKNNRTTATKTPTTENLPKKMITNQTEETQQIETGIETEPPASEEKVSALEEPSSDKALRENVKMEEAKTVEKEPPIQPPPQEEVSALEEPSSDKTLSENIGNKGEESETRMIENLIPPREVVTGDETSQSGGTEPGTDKIDLAAAPITSVLPYGTPYGDPDKKAVPIAGNPQPKYPFILRWKKIEGAVQTLVTVSPTGQVTDIQVTQSSHKNFTEETLKVLRYWKFQPNGRAYKTTIPFRFKLEGKAENLEPADYPNSENL